MTNEGCALLVQDLRAGYGAREILHGITFSVDQGSVSLLLGANGAGKSTTLGAIVGRVQRFSGSVHFAGVQLQGLDVPASVRAGIQLVPEGGRVFRDLSVRDNLRLGAFTVSDTYSAQMMDPVLEIFPRLGERLNQRGGTLSGGERQMLAIGRALMARPRLLLLDEPFLGLAPVVVNDVVAALSHINKELGISMLVVEQNVKAVKIADRAYVLGLGEITVVEDHPQRLVEEGSTAVQEGFLGGG